MPVCCTCGRMLPCAEISRRSPKGPKCKDPFACAAARDRLMDSAPGMVPGEIPGRPLHLASETPGAEVRSAA